MRDQIGACSRGWSARGSRVVRVAKVGVHEGAEEGEAVGMRLGRWEEAWGRTGGGLGKSAQGWMWKIVGERNGERKVGVVRKWRVRVFISPLCYWYW